MNKSGPHTWNNLREKWLSRRGLIRGAAGTALGAGLFRSKLVYARDDDGDHELTAGASPNPIPGFVAPFAPFGTLIHHNPLKATTPLAHISDPSQITDFDGFVGLTHIQGHGVGTDTMTGATSTLAFQADMGFSQGKFIGTDGHQHRGTLAFV